MSILKQAKQQNELEQQQLKEIQKQKKKKTKQIAIISCIGIGLILAAGLSIIAITKNKTTDKEIGRNTVEAGTDEENKKADNLASDSNIKPDWGNTKGTINSKDTSTSNGADINGSTKTFKPSDELRKYNEEASKANEKAE